MARFFCDPIRKRLFFRGFLPSIVGVTLHFVTFSYPRHTPTSHSFRGTDTHTQCTEQHISCNCSARGHPPRGGCGASFGVDDCRIPFFSSLVCCVCVCVCMCVEVSLMKKLFDASASNPKKPLPTSQNTLNLRIKRTTQNGVEKKIGSSNMTLPFTVKKVGKTLDAASFQSKIQLFLGLVASASNPPLLRMH